jgi:hypothetical protein
MPSSIVVDSRAPKVRHCIIFIVCPPQLRKMDV